MRSTMRPGRQAVVSAAEYHKPEVVLVENVEEFTDWALYPA